MAAEILLQNEVEQEIAAYSTTEFNEKVQFYLKCCKRGHAQKTRNIFCNFQMLWNFMAVFLIFVSSWIENFKIKVL
jgi:hypothetical protein